MEPNFCDDCFKKQNEMKSVLEQNEILLNALKQIELMGNGSQTKEAIFATLILNKVLKI